MRRHLVFGIAAAAGALWLTFFASVTAVLVATLAAAVVVLIWMSTVDTARLRDEHGRPHLVLLGLAATGSALVVTASVLMRTLTGFVVGLVVVVAAVVGIVRAIRAAMGPA